METFRRFEKKYLLDEQQYRKLTDLLKGHVLPDKFYETDIRSIYYDTDDHELIRRSIEKPEYKEKLRIRSYKEVTGDEMVFVELKKKFDGIVYKRRTKASSAQLLDDIYRCQFKDPQVGKEILYALDYYGRLKPSIFIGCKRTSFVGKEDRDLRITFDREICYRMEDLSLRKTEKDKLLTDKTVMELKIKDAMPLWLSEILDEVKAYPRGFSKVGNAFLKELQGV
ncbi:MAG: polyphosphate polymerase domain-containing protein [Erysipelotrichaceae bacterium]|nr:polyphosphate polymerase domain-containing protein [Erysipelotrichaceae bacterium]